MARVAARPRAPGELLQPQGAEEWREQEQNRPAMPPRVYSLPTLPSTEPRYLRRDAQGP